VTVRGSKGQEFNSRLCNKAGRSLRRRHVPECWELGEVFGSLMNSVYRRSRHHGKRQSGRLAMDFIEATKAFGTTTQDAPDA